MSLTPRQQAFVREYLIDLNATQAAIRAGYSADTAEQQGSRLLSNRKVRRVVDTAKARRAARLDVKADDVLRELLAIAHADIGDAFTRDGQLKPLHKMSESVRRAIASIEVDELWEGSGEERSQVGWTKKVRLWSKPESLVAIGKHLKMFVDVHENKHSFPDMTDEQLEARYRELVAKGSASATAAPVMTAPVIVEPSK